MSGGPERTRQAAGGGLLIRGGLAEPLIERAGRRPCAESPEANTVPAILADS
jgi:hypothetical protein